MTINDYVSSVERLELDLHAENKWSHRLESLSIGLVYGCVIGLICLGW